MLSLFSIRVLKSSEEIRQWHKKPNDRLTYQIKGRCNVSDKWKLSLVPIGPMTLAWVRSGRERMCCLWRESLNYPGRKRTFKKKASRSLTGTTENTYFILHVMWLHLEKSKKRSGQFPLFLFSFPFKKILGIGHHYDISGI